MGAISLVRRTLLLSFILVLAAAAAGAQGILVDNATSEPVTLSTTNLFQNISVTVTPAGSFTVMVAEQNVPGANWVSACVGSNCATETTPATISSTATATMTIQLTNDLGGSGAGPFLATVTLTAPSGSATISVTYQPGINVTNPITVTPSSLTVGVAGGGTANNMLTLTNNTQSTVTINQVTGSAAWLTGSAASTSVAAGGQDIISVTTTAGTLSSGSYSGTLQISFVGYPEVTVPVAFNVGAPGLNVSTVDLELSYNNGTSQSQSVTVSGATGSSPAYNATASTVSGGNWLDLIAGSQNSTTVTSVPIATPLTVLVASTVASTLSTGSYSGSITVTDANNANNTANISVTLSVTVGGATSISVYPSSLSFYAQTNGQTPPYQTVVLTAPTGQYSASVTSGQVFLGSGTAGGTIPGNLQVAVANLGGLAAGTYTGQITITAQGVTQNVPVTLTISTAPVAEADFSTSSGESGTVLFTSSGTAATPSSQAVSIFASDSSALTTLSVASSPSWLSVSESGTQLTLTPNVSGLGNAVYSGVVTVNANNATGTIYNTPISIPVILTTTGGSTTGQLTFSPTSLSFQSSSGTVSPATQNISLTAASATQFTFTSDSWITVSYSNTNGNGNEVTPGEFTVSVNPAGLPNGLNSGSINVTAGGVTQTIPVSLTVSGNTSTAGTVSASPQTLNFTAAVGGASQSQTVTVSSSGGPVSFTVSPSSAAPWLTATPSTASTQSNVTVTVNPSGLAVGNYQGTVTISAGNTITITVNLTVQALPVISASTSNLTFSYVSGGSATASQTVTINGSTGGFTATAADDVGTWLSVTPTSGNAGSTITVSVDPSGISAGQHSGTITVAGTNGLAGQVVISVALTINGALPSVSTVVNGASFFSGAVSPGEVITLFGTNLGAAGQTFTAQIGSSGTLATQLGGVQVFVDNFAAPMIYVSATQVSAVVPYEIAPYAKANIWLSYQGQTSNIVTLATAATAPGIFTQNSSGSGAAGYNANFSVNGPNNPAPKGSTITLFLTGEGQTVPPGVTGTINSSPTGNPVPAASISVLIGGQPAQVSYAGGVDGVVEGILQLNAQVPANAPDGAVPVVVTIGGNSTQGGVTISVQ